MVDEDDDGRPDLGVSRSVKLWSLVAIALLHVLVFLGLVRALAPDFSARVVEQAVSAFTVTITAPPPEPSPTPQAPEAAGAAAEAGKQAKPRENTAPKPRIAVAKPTQAPTVSSTGNAVTSGATAAGSGTGAGGQGTGTGSGTGGNGQGGGTRLTKTAGDINSARDYPIATREQRIDDYVVIAITVGSDGKPKACRVHRPSKDEQANAITCRLAMQRFRFRAATDASGNPVEAVYGWKQTWHY